MKTISLFFSFWVIVTCAFSQDTFSIVAADSATREVGSAGASCVDLFAFGITDPGFLGDLLPDTGAINTQAYYLATNQNNARTRMRAGDSPQQIISWLISNDAGSNPAIRQYGITGFMGNNLDAAAYTGVNTQNYKNHVTGSINGIYYSIQGNILLGQHVLDSMESKFINAQGDLACRLMAALQGAKMIGADTRCAANGTSSLFAFLKVSQPTDNYGNPSFNIGVRTPDNSQIEPIDTLQIIFDLQHNCTTNLVNSIELNNLIKVYPIPSEGKIIISADKDIKLLDGEIIIFNLLGENVFSNKINSAKQEIELSKLEKGIYFYQIKNKKSILKTGKLILN